MITDGLTALEVQLRASTGMNVTRDPSMIIPPCLFIDVPTVVGRTMGAVTVTVPVHFVVPGPADIHAHDALCDGIELVLDACGEASAQPNPFDAGGGTLFPAMTVTTTITIQRS